MPKPAILAVAALAFLLPVSLVTYQHRDRLQELWQPDPRQGQLLFFTSPS